MHHQVAEIGEVDDVEHVLLTQTVRTARLHDPVLRHHGSSEIAWAVELAAVFHGQRGEVAARYLRVRFLGISATAMPRCRQAVSTL